MQVRTKQGGDVVCRVANYLFPQGRVVSGHNAALDEVRKGVRRPVLGALYPYCAAYALKTFIDALI